MAKRRPEWLVVLGMLAGASVTGFLVVWATFPATWGALLAGVLAIPGAFVGGVAVTWKENRV